MIKVNNRKAIRNLANKSFCANKTRNIIAVLAIALTTILFTSLFTMGSGMVESLEQATMRQAGGDGHAVLKYMTDEQFHAVKDHASIKEIAYDKMLCDGVKNEALLKRRAEFWYYDDVGLKLGFIELEAGGMPQAENEVIADSQTLKLLGVPPLIGSPITLELTIRGELVTREFVLSGWWTSNPAFNIGQIFASRAYVDAYSEELESTYYQDHSMTGAISAYIMFRDSMNLQGKLDTLLLESGYSSVETDENYLAGNVNWAYLSTNFGMDAGSILSLGCGLLLIIFTGYLIIYNIFQISIIRDIRFYGMLKTIGTTGSQLRRILYRQAFLLSAIGIPIGLILGFFSGKALVPLLMSNSSYMGSGISVSANPIILIGSALFSLVTVFISTFKPGRMAGRVSPMEAVRYTGNGNPGDRITGHKIVGHKIKRSRNGAKMSHMARANLLRNKKRTVLVIISLSLSLVLFNTIATLSSSIDMDKFLSKFTDSDFLIAHADYFNNDYYGADNEVSEQMIAAVEALDGFEEGGRLYGGRENAVYVTDPENLQQHNRNDRGDIVGAMFGLEALPMQRIELLDGGADREKLLSGDYILEGVHLDDNNKAEWGSAHYNVGDMVTLHHYADGTDAGSERRYVTRNYTVLGHIAVKTYTNSDRIRWDYTFYLPAEVYKNSVENPSVMSYAFDEL